MESLKNVRCLWCLGDAEIVYNPYHNMSPLYYMFCLCRSEDGGWNTIGGHAQTETWRKQALANVDWKHLSLLRFRSFQEEMGVSCNK